MKNPRSSHRTLSGKEKRCIAISHPVLASFLFALLISGVALPAEGAIIPTRIEFFVLTTAGARDGTNYDLPPDQSVSVITNGFWAFETNLASTASIGGASAQCSALQWANVLPLSITAAATNRDNSAASLANCRLNLLFDLPVQHSYSINVTNLGGVSPGILLGQIILTRNGGEEVFASRLPTNSGPASQTGVLLSGSYRLLAEFVVSPAIAPPASSGSATYSLQMTFDPILPTLNIA